jgi:tryptophan synthase beta subunit
MTAFPATLESGDGRFGPYGGRYVPEALIAALDQLTEVYAEARVVVQQPLELRPERRVGAVLRGRRRPGAAQA